VLRGLAIISFSSNTIEGIQGGLIFFWMIFSYIMWFKTGSVTPLQKAPSSRWGIDAFCQSRDVAF